MADALAGGLAPPDILFCPVGSPNELTGVITAQMLSIGRAATMRIWGQCRDYGISPVFWTELPANSSIKVYGASDSLRKDYNLEMLARAVRGMPMIDLASTVAGALDGTGQQQFAAGMSLDGLHPGDAGLAVMSVPAPAMVLAHV